MRSLSATLEAAQKAPSRQPVVKCIVDDRPVEAPRLTWTTLYSGSEQDYFCGAAICSDGSIVRVRSDSAGNFYRQRVTDPTQTSQWSSWTQVYSGVSTLCQVAAAKGSTAGVVRIYLVAGAAGSRVVYGCGSADNGQSWGSWETVATPPAGSEVRSLAAVEDYVVYSVDPQGTNPDDYLCVVKKTGGAWGAPSADSQTFSTISTAGVAREGDYLRVAFYCEGTSELRNRGWNTTDSTWSGGVVLLAAGSGSSYSYLYPWLLVPDSDAPRYLYMYREYFNGSPAHGRRMLCCTPSRDYLTEMVPLVSTGLMQVVLLKGGGYWYLIGSKEAYRAPVYTGGSTEKVEVSADVVAVEINEPGDMRPSRLVLWLENSTGKYQQAGVAGTTYAVLAEGSQVAVGLGYRTAAGDEHLWGVPWWVDRLSFEDEGGVGRLRIEAIDAWEYLERLRVHRQEVFSNATLGDILQRIWWRVCGETTAPTAGGLSTTVPLFTFQPGESYADIARRICQRSGVALRFGSDQNSYTGFSSVKPALVTIGTGSAQYAYAPSTHRIRQGQYNQGGQVANHLEVYGTGAFGEQLDGTRMGRVMKDIVRKVVDKELDTNAKAADVALYLLRWEQMALYGGWMEVWANVAQELWDVVSVTESRANLNAAPRRVASLVTYYDRQRGRFQQRIGLAGV